MRIEFYLEANDDDIPIEMLALSEKVAYRQQCMKVK